MRLKKFFTLGTDQCLLRRENSWGNLGWGENVVQTLYRSAGVGNGQRHSLLCNGGTVARTTVFVSWIKDGFEGGRSREPFPNPTGRHHWDGGSLQR